ncbi:carbon storage regulator CsrA [Pseudomonas sp. p1(2021b)]|uniref:carbon storage regulator CsrA n=1 Tax=Pseudomonas sp. p1(2021b) TaxID=2874628 RepID=UPI00398D0F5F
MLVFTREIGEGIVICDDIYIKVVSSKDKAVRFGISAPLEVQVHREEVYRRIKANQANEAPAGLGAGPGTPSRAIPGAPHAGPAAGTVGSPGRRG